MADAELFLLSKSVFKVYSGRSSTCKAVGTVLKIFTVGLGANAVYSDHFLRILTDKNT